MESIDNLENQNKSKSLVKQMIKKIFPRIILLDVLLAGALFAGICALLAVFQLSFRQWVYAVIAFVLGFPGIIGLFQILGYLKHRVLKIVLTWIIVIGVVCVTPIVLIMAYILYKPEHILTRDDQKYVAYVNSASTTNVRFYEYHNFLVCGLNPRIEEVYESGFDPYATLSENHRKPNITYYFDESGNLLK